MQYYKNIDELLKGIGDISASAAYKSTRYGYHPVQDQISSIAGGTTIPTISSANKLNKPTIINRISETGVYKPETATTIKPETEKQEQKQPIKIFGLEAKPIWTITKEDLLNDAQFLGSKLAQGVNFVTRTLSPANIANTAFAISSATSNVLINPILKAIGRPELKNITLTKAVTNVVQSAVGGKIDTSNISNQTVKNIAQDINDGTDILTGLSNRSSQFFAGKESEVSDRVSYATKIIGSVLESAPQTAVLALPYGSALFMVSAAAGAIEGQTVKGEISNKDMEYALYSASTEIASEMIFDLFGQGEDVLPAFLKNNPKTSELIWYVLKKGGEEGSEELISFPFQLFLDWRYKNPEAPVTDYLNWDTLKNWGEAGLVGFISGGIMVTPQVIASKRLSNKEQMRAKELSDKIVNSAVNNVKEDDVVELSDLIAKSGVTPENVQTQTNAIPASENILAPAEYIKQLMQEAEAEYPQGNVPTEAVQVPTGPSAVERVKVSSEAVKAPSTALQSVVHSPESIVNNGVRGKQVSSSVSSTEDVATTISANTATDITPSIDANANPVSGYDTRLQPRDVDRVGTALLIDEIAKNPKIKDLFSTDTLQNGIPVVSENGMVIAGNHRVAGIMKMMKINPSGYAQYKQYAIDHAEELGLDKTKLKGNFIVTRIVPSGYDIYDLADKSNVERIRRMSSSEYAKRDSSRLTSKVLSLFVANENGEINTSDNRAFISRFLDEIIPETERDSYTDAKGVVNVDGIARIRNALFYKAYGSTKLLNLIAESTDNNVKRLTSSLVNIAPKIVYINENIKNGDLYDVGLSDLIVKSAERWVNMKKNNSPVLMYAMQQEIGDTKQTVREKNFLLAMDVNKGSAVKLTGFYNELINTITDAGSPKQIGLFANTNPTIDDILQVAMENGGYENVAKTEIQSESGAGVEQEKKTEAPKVKAEEVKQQITVSTDNTVKIGSKYYTKQQIQNSLSRLQKRFENPLNDADRQEIVNKMEKLNKAMLKLEKKQTETQTRGIEEMVAEEGKKEASAEAAIGIVSTGYAKAVSEAAIAQPRPWRSIESEETQKRIDDAFDPKSQAGWNETLKHIIKNIQINVFSGGVPVNKKYGDFRIAYRNAGIAWQIANKKSWSIITSTYDHAGKSKQELLTRSILYADMKETIDKGKYNAEYGLVFGVKSPQQVLDLYKVTQKELLKPENSLAKEAFDMRKERMKEIRNELIAVAKKCNVDLSRLASYEDYMTHYTLQYSDEFNGIKNKNRRRKAIDYNGREGSPLDYIANPVITDFLIVKKMIQDTERFKLFAETKKFDISSTLKVNENGEWDIPEGYSEIDPSSIGVKGIEDVLNKKQIMTNAYDAIAQVQWSLSDPRAKHVISNALKKANKYTMVVPTDMVNAIDALNKPFNTASKWGQKLTNIWKYSRIRIPGKVWRYNLRNMYGDIDAALMLRPSSIAWIPKSIYQLHQYYYKGRIVDPELMHYIERNGLITGEARVNMRTFKDIKGLNIYEELNAKTLGVKGIKKLWSALTMETFTDFREQVLRYAVYRSVYKEISTNGTGLPKYYMASLKDEIKGITNYRDRAAKLSNDAIGAYDDVSMFGKYMADHIMPFFRFYEVNMKRYFRMTFNTFRYDPDLMAAEGNKFARYAKQFGKWGAFTTYKVAKTLIGLGLFQGLMLSLWNNLFAGKEEDELPEDVKRKPHLTMPGWLFGDDNIHYISDLGSFSEFLSYFGLDYGVMNDIKDIATGRLNVDDYLKNAAKSSLFDIVTGSMPGVQLVIAALGGVTIFPDPTKPVQIKDTLEYIADQAGLKDEYKAIAGLPMPEGQYSQQFIQRIFKEITPGEAAVWDAYDLVNKYRELNNLGESYSTRFDYKTEAGKRHLAAYNYKVALKMQDKEAAQKYLAEYIANGGTGGSLENVIRWWYPAAGLSASEKESFESWLLENPEDWETYSRANSFVDSLASEARSSESSMP